MLAVQQRIAVATIALDIGAEQILESTAGVIPGTEHAGSVSTNYRRAKSRVRTARWAGTSDFWRPGVRRVARDCHLRDSLGLAAGQLALGALRASRLIQGAADELADYVGVAAVIRVVRAAALTVLFCLAQSAEIYASTGIAAGGSVAADQPDLLIGVLIKHVATRLALPAAGPLEAWARLRPTMPAITMIVIMPAIVVVVLPAACLIGCAGEVVVAAAGIGDGRAAVVGGRGANAQPSQRPRQETA